MILNSETACYLNDEFINNTMQNYIKYTPEFDELNAEEQQLLDEAVVSIKEAVAHSEELNGRKTRNFHAKTHAGIVGNFTVITENETLKKINPFPSEDLSVLVRFSNAESKILSDKLSLPAFGMSLKITSEKGFESNFPLVNFPIFPTNSVTDLLKVVIAVNRVNIDEEKDRGKLMGTLDVMAKFSKLSIHAGFLPMLNVIKKAISIKKDFVLNPIYHSIGCYRFGDFVCKFRMVPKVSYSIEKFGEAEQQEMLKAVMTENTVEFILQIQLSENTDEQPINDLMEEWPAEKFEDFALLYFPIQKVINSKDRELEKMNFSPFENPEGMLPVGKIQQTRLKAYKASFEARKKFNT